MRARPVYDHVSIEGARKFDFDTRNFKNKGELENKDNQLGLSMPMVSSDIPDPQLRKFRRSNAQSGATADGRYDDPTRPTQKARCRNRHFPLLYQMPSDPPLKGLKVVELGGMAPVPFVGYPSVLR